MTYALLIEIAWKSVVTSGLALLLLALLKNRSAAERSWVAHAGLVATLLLPAAVMLLPDWAVEAPAAFPGTAFEADPTTAAAPLALPGAISSDEAMIGTGPDLWALSFWAYLVPAALLLLTTLAAVLRLFALRRRASVLVEQTWVSALAHAQRRMGFKHGTALLVSNELASPVSWGVLRPIILLNEEAVALKGEAEAIIAHELAHVARLDWAKLLIARAATAIFWFNPLVWILARDCHQLREEAADDAVLRSDVPETDYAALLVGAARHENNGVLLAAHGVAPGRTSLKRRVTRILDTSLSRTPARGAWAAGCSAGAILISAPLSALTPVNPVPASLASAEALAAPLPIASVGVSTPAPLPAPTAVITTSSGGSARARALVLTSSASAAAAEIAEATASAASPLPPVPPTPVPAPLALARSDRLLSPDMLVKMRIHGVTPQYAQELAAISPLYADLSPEQLVSFRIHGVTASLIRELAELGYRDLTHRQLSKMAIQGVKPSFIREMAALGFRSLSAEELTKMRIYGVSPAYVREFRNAGYHDVTAQELIKMRIHGVTLEPRPPTPPTPPGSDP